jgi:hypothetical protein
MDYLVRFDKGKLHQIAHFVHEVNGISGALCSPQPKPVAGEQTQSGRWELVTAIPPTIKLCLVCQKRKQKLDNPLPARVEKELELLARLDPRAAAFQREKMLAQYG